MCLGRSEVRLASRPPFSVLGPPKKRKKINWAMFPGRGRLLSGQQSSTSSRLLYDGLACFLGSTRSSTI